MPRPIPLERFTVRGLRVVYEHAPGPTTALALTVNAGARYDRHSPGLAHMAEHMLFQGTKQRDQLALNRRAAEVGRNHNASTGYETISLTIEVFNEDFADAVELLADQFYRSRVDPERFAKERRVVEDEIRGYRDDPADFVNERGWAAFFAEPIGHPICGTIASLRAMRSEDVVRFLRARLVNVNAVLGVVGGVARQDLRRVLERNVARDRVGRPARATRVRRGRNGVLRVGGGPRGQACVARYLEVETSPRALLALGVALDLVGADPDSQLFQAIREQHGLGYDVGADLEWGNGWAVAVLSASTHPGRSQRLQRVIDQVVERAAVDGFDPGDVARARKKCRHRYAALAERRLDRALAHADSTLTGFPDLDEAERIVTDLEAPEILAAWRRAAAGRTLTALLDGR